jgi:hypothetical protein
MSKTTSQNNQSTTLLQAIRLKLDAIEVHNPKIAHCFCRFIPAHCPFEQDIRCFGRLLIHIPPLCKLNPFYEQLISLRFKALSYLAEACGEDITFYCQ